VDLAAQGLTEAQVQAVWLKEADARPTSSLPNADADAYTLETLLGDVIRSAKTRYPNLQCVFVTNRSYAGYAISDLNPEPYAYESGRGQRIVQAQIDQMANGGVIVDPRAGDPTSTRAPWIGWAHSGPTAIPRGDRLVWRRGSSRTTSRTPRRWARPRSGTCCSPSRRPARRWFLALSDVAIAPSSDGGGTTVSVWASFRTARS
jgi:hypothetical protein